MLLTEELQEMARRAEEVVAPAVVRIGRPPGRGVGLVVAPGAVATNAHNLRGPETTVTFADGRQATGAARAVDADGDLAVVEVDTANLVPPGWAGGPPGLGAPVLAVVTLPGGGSRVTAGTVSALGQAFRGPRGRLLTGALEHTAPLARGSSGSPLVDAAGEVVGLSTQRLVDGFYLALPADPSLAERLRALVAGRAPRRPYLGLALLPGSAARRLRAAVGLDEREGLLVRAVDDGSPAAAAGVRPGDLLVRAGGRPLRTPDDLFDVLASDELADLHLEVVRGSEELEIVVSLHD